MVERNRLINGCRRVDRAAESVRAQHQLAVPAFGYLDSIESLYRNGRSRPSLQAVHRRDVRELPGLLRTRDWSEGSRIAGVARVCKGVAASNPAVAVAWKIRMSGDATPASTFSLAVRFAAFRAWGRDFRVI